MTTPLHDLLYRGPKRGPHEDHGHGDSRDYSDEECELLKACDVYRQVNHIAPANTDVLWILKKLGYRKPT